MNSIKFLILFIFSFNSVFSQNTPSVDIFELLKNQSKVQIEYLMRTENKNLEGIKISDKGKQLSLVDTMYWYSFNLKFNQIDRENFNVRLYNYRLNHPLSNLDTLNNIYQNFFDQIDFNFRINSDFEIIKVSNQNKLIDLGKDCKSKSELILNSPLSFSNDRVLKHTVIQIPTNKKEVERFLSWHLIIYLHYNQDFSIDYRYPEPMKIGNRASPIQDTTFVKKIISENQILLQNEMIFTEDESIEFIKSQNSTVGGMNPFNFLSQSNLYLDRLSGDLMRYTNESKFESENYFSYGILEARIKNVD